MPPLEINKDIKETYGIRHHYLENCWTEPTIADPTQLILVFSTKIIDQCKVLQPKNKYRTAQDKMQAEAMKGIILAGALAPVCIRLTLAKEQNK